MIPLPGGASTLFDFHLRNLGVPGYNTIFQDLPVDPDIYSSQGLKLSGDLALITACGNNCISANSPYGKYAGTITGNFEGKTYGKIDFWGAEGDLGLNLYDINGNFVTALAPNTSKPDTRGNVLPVIEYDGTVGIGSFIISLNFDGLVQLAVDDEIRSVDEPSAFAMLLVGLAPVAAFRFWNKPFKRYSRELST
jgi:hypothetical protein